MNPGPVGERLVRGYGPVLLLAVLVLGMAVFVPSRPQRTTVSGTAPTGPLATVPGGGTGTTVAGAEVPGGAAGPGTSTGPGAAPGATGEAPPPPAVAAAGVSDCADRTEQVPGDPYSPRCIAFDGDNGGATHRGVTATEIHVAVRTVSDANLDAAIAELVGTEIADTPADVRRTLDVLVEYFNSRFQFYGRRIVLDHFQGQGSLASELQGNGRETAEVDATRVAEELGAFAEISAFSEPYSDALVRRGVLAFGAPILSREWFADRRPYAWSVLPDCSGLTEDAAEFILKRLRGGTADFAGGPLRGRPRVITALAPDNNEYQQCVRGAERLLAEAGYAFHVAPISYQLNLNTMSNQAANIVPRLQAEGVTTILCGCDPIFPIFLSGIANREGYFPEFVSGYEQDFIGQLWDPNFTRQAFGISPLGGNASQARDAGWGYAAYKSIRQDEPAHGVDGIYYQLYLLAIGIQLAGPNLTPATFEAGMFSYGEHFGEAGLWGFGPNDYTPMDDYHEMYWDPDAVSSYNGRPGAWVDPQPGRRYRHGADEMEPGPPQIPRR